MAQDWLSIVEYARKHNISDMTVRRRIKSGKLVAELKDGKYFIPDNDAVSSQNRVVAGRRPETGEHLTSFQNDIQAVVTPLPKRNTSSSNRGIAEKVTFRSAVTPEMRLESGHIPDQSGREYNRQVMDNVLRGQSQGALRENPSLKSRPSAQQESMELAEKIDSLSSLCQKMMRKIESDQNNLKKVYEQKMATLSVEIENKNMQILHLKEQIEDLNLLVKVLENKTR